MSRDPAARLSALSGEYGGFTSVPGRSKEHRAHHAVMTKMVARLIKG